LFKLLRKLKSFELKQLKLQIMVDLDIVIVKDKEVGGYISIVPSLPGCHTQGDSLEEVIKNTREAVSLYIKHSMKKKNNHKTKFPKKSK